MKPALIAALAAMILASPVPRAQAADVLTVAILDFESKDEAVKGLGPKVAALLNADLSADPQLMTVEREELDKALGEQEMGLSGTVTSATAGKVGQLTGARVLVTGRAFQADHGLFLVAKIIGTETGRVYGEVVNGGEGASIVELSSELAKKIASDITTKSDALIAKAESREEKIDRISKLLKDGKRPSVSVKIEERHFGQPVIDPAAETELTRILQKLGFPILDDKSTNKADVEITGQAFSAYGMRKGNLISCRSRIELKAHERSSGAILAADSQTSVAVDVAEQTAAKTALENAALEIAERVAPKLVR